MRLDFADMTGVGFKTAKVYDAGGYILISGPSEADVNEALNILITEDKAELISRPARVGSSWLAACSHPLRKRIPCKLQREGFTVVVTGPTKEAVTVAVLELMEHGARLLQNPAEVDGEWSAVADIAGVDDTGAFNWSMREYRR